MDQHEANITAKLERDQLTKKNSIQSPLLRLPAELKDEIFSYVFGGQTIYVEHTRSAISQRLAFVLQPPDFTVLRSWSYFLEPLLLCRHVYEEAKLHFYRHNIFVFRHEEALNVFLRERTQAQINAVSSLKPPALVYERIRDGMTFRNEAKTFKARFPNLKTVYLEEGWGQVRRPLYAAAGQMVGYARRLQNDSPEAMAERMQEVEGGTIKIVVEMKKKEESDAERVNNVIRQFEDGVIRWPQLSSR
ncbi:hypothetical protein BDV96DRAFT_569855 [Lophiotrema nucula]|uniref:DUF7730 domain-containing protein n=1 Tax=Lophiotrema nucula TaxID=690887 RepID=A0A6A5ZG03_9PLEO|nr:hypothetical protein BDV96DRAFT_569855 [Lophiotrema nucula]